MAYLAFVSSSFFAGAIWFFIKDGKNINPFRLMLKRSLKTTETVFSDLVAMYFPIDFFRLKKLKNYLTLILLRSGMVRLFPWFQVRHLALMLILAFFGGSWLLKKLGIISLIYGGAAVLTLFSVLLLLAALNKQAIRKAYLNFLNVYSGFYNIEQNEINALMRTAEYMQEPLKTILIKWTTRYKATNISVDDCLEGILNEVGDKEFRKFIKFTKVNARYGGDYKKAIEKLKEQGEKLQSVYQMKASTAVVGTFIIIFMIALNLFLILFAINDPILINILKSTGQGQLILGGNAAGIIMAILIIFNINKD